MILSNNEEEGKNTEKPQFIDRNGSNSRNANPYELLDTTKRRLILIASDCVSDLWRKGIIFPTLQTWTAKQQVAILQMLPRVMWRKSALGLGMLVNFSSSRLGVANQELTPSKMPPFLEEEIRLTQIPILSLEKEPTFEIETENRQRLFKWTEMLLGKRDSLVSGYLLPPELQIEDFPALEEEQKAIENQDAEQRIARFRRMTSPIGRKLAGLLAAAPVIRLPIVRLIQECMLPQSDRTQIAEVFLGGLLKHKAGFELDINTDPETVEYEFIDPKIRDIFVSEAPISDSIDVVNAVSRVIAEQIGVSMSNFMAMLKGKQKADNKQQENTIKPFAEVTARVLRKLGSPYTELAGELENNLSIEFEISQSNEFTLNSELTSSFLRYPYLECPSVLVIDRRFSLFIKTLIQPPQTGIEAIEIKAPEIPEQLSEVEIVIRARGFDIEGSNSRIIQVERNDDTKARFVLIPRKSGEQQIRVDFYQNGERIGTVRKNILINSTTRETPQPPNPTVLELKNEFFVPPPDLELFIELDKNDGRTLYYTLHSVKSNIDYHHKAVGQVILKVSPAETMKSVYEELDRLAERVSPIDIPTKQKEYEDRLNSVGYQLWDQLIPQELKAEYWNFKDKVKSFLITSDEPWIPWEMIKPYDFERELEQSFWCEQFSMSRWLSGNAPATELSASTIISVTSNNSNSPNVRKEIDFLQNLNNLSYLTSSTFTISNRLELSNHIKNVPFSILHFICHEMFDSNSSNGSAISLTGDSFSPSDIPVKFKETRPIIFINVCHSVRVGFSFTKIGNWAEKFINARAGVFIGTMWEVNDKLAFQFAKTFYTALLKDNLTIGEAFQKSRQVIRDLAPYNSTWLAYSLYANPQARIQKPKILKKLKFETVTVNSSGKIIETKAHQNNYYEEPLGETISPIIMMAIPEGEFIMGSPEDEPRRYDDESPLHKVKVAPFWLAQTPVTNAQWHFVVNLPKEQRELTSKKEMPEKENHPVTKVNWYDAIEFCARLSRHTGRNYRLPTEAEWEYTCRAESETPFHFGATITSELANYRGTEIYANEPKGEYRGDTVSVKSFFPNVFGIYDMHGQVWEWCADPWHNSYNNAPEDSLVWDEKNNVNLYHEPLKHLEILLKDDRSRIRRGGSWSRNPRSCRSACRYSTDPVYAYDNDGFRVVVSGARTP